MTFIKRKYCNNKWFEMLKNVNKIYRFLKLKQL